MWAERKNFQAGVHHKKISLLLPNGYSKLRWPIMPLVESIIVLRERLLKHVSRVSGWLPCRHFEGTVRNHSMLFMQWYLVNFPPRQFTVTGFICKVGSLLDDVKVLVPRLDQGTLLGLFCCILFLF